MSMREKTSQAIDHFVYYNPSGAFLAGIAVISVLVGLFLAVVISW